MKLFKQKPKKLPSEITQLPSVSENISHWLCRVETLIATHSTKPRKRGPYKGHASSNQRAWVLELMLELLEDQRKRSSGAYDGNMVIARELGMILAVWYANVHRAKSYDIHRPLELRKKANLSVNEYYGQMTTLMAADWLMWQVWPSQVYNFPYGLGAAGGDFV